MPLLVHASRREIRLEDEDDFDHALTSPDLDDALARTLTQGKDGVVGFVHAIYGLARLEGLPSAIESDHGMIRERPLRFLPYPRHAAIDDLNAMAGHDLYASETYKTRALLRTVAGSRGFRLNPSDRYLAINAYGTGLKDGADVIASPFLMVEIDDVAVIQEIDDALSWAPDADVSPIILRIAAAQCRIAQRAVAWLVPKDFEVPPPFYACYSGYKSIHFLFRFDEPLIPKERVACAESSTDLSHGFKRMKSEDLKLTPEQDVFTLVDHAPLFSPTAMVRIPCNELEWSDKHARFRHPQVAWHVTDDPLNPNFDTLPRAGVVERAKARIQDRMDRLFTMKRYTYEARQERPGLRNVTREEVEGALGKG